MKNLICGLALALSTNSVFALEYNIEFVEFFRSRSCSTSKDEAKERISKQFQSGSDVYSGSVKEFQGKKIIRFVQNHEGCEAVWSEALGMLYDYRLRIQVAGN